MEFSINVINNRKVIRNIASNYIGSVFISLVPILTLPIYINSLGPKLWGLVTFVGMLVSWLSILEAGLSQAMIKDFSEYSENNTKKAELLYGFERVYFTFAFFISILSLIFSRFIVNNWINEEGFAKNTVNYTIYAGVFLFFVQFPGSLYRTVLSGLQEQVLLNKIVTAFIFIRNVLGIVLIYFYPSIFVYFLWQCICSLFETIVKYKFSWKLVNINKTFLSWNGIQMYKAIKSSSLIVISVMLGIALMTIDKLYISKMLTLEQLAYYGVAYSLAIAVLRFINPIQVALQPRLVELKNNPDLMFKTNLELMLLCVFIIILVSICFVFFGFDLLYFWLRNESVVKNVYPVLSLLLIGSAINSLYNIGYINWIAKGYGNKIFKINLFSLILSIGILPIFISTYGLAGACFSWIFVNAIGFVLSLDWLVKK